MTLQILPTKLFIPPLLPTLVKRPRLIETLESGRHRKLTLISAPAGYGKSTLLSEWVHQAGNQAAWLSLDPTDNDPGRFWTHFIAALRSLSLSGDSSLGKRTLEMLRNAPLQENKNIFSDLLIEIAGIPDPFLLILDDLHLVTEVEILDRLFSLLENLPAGMSGMHLVISSRGDPPWPLARLRGQGQITELRARDLRFTQEEVTQFLNQVMQLGLPAYAITQLDHRTEGWAAGLQMAAIALGGPLVIKEKNDIDAFLEGFSGEHRFVLDYLVEEVLNHQKPEHLDFLLRTSILERLNGPLCTAVTGDDASAEVLLQLEKANMFLLTLDDQRNWYRYHHLFADLLQKQLRVRQPELIPELHRRASNWYAQAGFGIEAVAHAIKTRDWQFAAGQIEEHVQGLIQQGNISLTRQWMLSLPEEVIRHRPILCLAQAWASTRFDTAALAEEMLNQAETALLKKTDQDSTLNPDIQQWVSRQIAVLQVVISRVRGDTTQQQQELALAALEQLEKTGDSAARATLFFRLGLCYLDLGKGIQADRSFRKAIELGQSSGNHYAVHAANYGRMVIFKLNGQLHALADLCRRRLEDEPVVAKQHPMIGIESTMLGVVCYEWNEINEAEHHLNRGLELVEQVGIAELLIKGHFTLGCLKAAQGQLGSNFNLVRLAEHSYLKLASYAAALQARLDLLLAQQREDALSFHNASHWAENQTLTLQEQSTYDWEMGEKLVYARVLCRQYQLGPDIKVKRKLMEVIQFLAEQRHPLEELGWQGILIELDVVQALVLQTLGRTAEALSTLERVLSLAETQGFVRTFVDEGELMRDLLQQIPKSSKFAGYVRKLLAAFDRQTTRTPSMKIEARLVDSFSERETQVLRLLNTHLSVPEIAAEIHLAPTTVRTHIQNIYRKLDVHGRMEALQKAEEYGLL